MQSSEAEVSGGGCEQATRSTNHQGSLPASGGAPETLAVAAAGGVGGGGCSFGGGGVGTGTGTGSGSAGAATSS